jgi:death-on-curing protein
MNEPIWLDVEIMIDLHAEQLALFGGPDGIRDQGMLESALGRPINKFTYGETDLAALAAAYAFGIARNHQFVDGNKRAAFGAIIVFLGLNDIDFLVPPESATAMILSLAAGEVNEEGLTRWIRDNWPPEARNCSRCTNAAPALPLRMDCGNSTPEPNIDWGDRWQSITKWPTRPLTATIIRPMSRPMRVSSCW